MSAINIGYIGNGKSTNRYHLPYVLQRKDLFTVRKIWQRSPRPEWAKIEGVQYVTDIEDILSDPEIEVIVVTTPPLAHYEMVKRVLENHKNCVCEKPMTLSYKEARELFALAEKNSVMLQCYQNRRFDSDFLTVQKVIESGRLGDLTEIEMHFDYFRPEVPDSRSTYKREESFVYNHACHTVDQVLSYFGNPSGYTADVRSLNGPDRMNDYFDIDMFYAGFKVSIRSSYYRVVHRPSFVVWGKKGMFIKYETDRQEFDLKHFYMPDHDDFGLDQPEHYGMLRWYDNNNCFHEEKIVSERGDYGRYYDALYRTVRDGAPQLVSREQTLTQMEILENCILLMENKNQERGNI